MARRKKRKANPKRKTTKKKVCRTVRRKRHGRTVKVKVQACTTNRKRKVKPKPIAPTVLDPRPIAMVPVPVGVVEPQAPVNTGPGGTTPPPSGPAPTAVPSDGLVAYAGSFGEPQARRLLWRAGFGPRPGESASLAQFGLDGAVQSLTRPPTTQTFTGPAPTDQDGAPLAPLDAWGHDHLWWLDRMVRADQPLVERLALILHDWFATSAAKVNERALLFAQLDTFRTQGFGSFPDLVHKMTRDPAMLLWLDGIDNRDDEPNENYARELMELFTLGADRGAYTETDVREMARALTGWRATWSDGIGFHDFVFDPNRHDAGSKTIFGQTGTFDWEDAARLVTEHPLHASFFVTKLWSYFIPHAPSERTRTDLEKVYVDGGRQVRPVLEAILTSSDLYLGGTMVKPPIVLTAGALRTVWPRIDTEAWSWRADDAGQRLLFPPNVAGWNDARWLDTSTVRGRWDLIAQALSPTAANPWSGPAYSATETPEEALAAALGFWAAPPLGAATVDRLLAFAQTCLPSSMANWQQSPYRAMRQNALRQLIGSAPEMQVS